MGIALGLRAQGLREAQVWVLIGDGKLDEGSNHEAIAIAGPAGLEQLHTVVDNSCAGHARTGGIAARFEAAGWSAVTADGPPPQRPSPPSAHRRVSGCVSPVPRAGRSG